MAGFRFTTAGESHGPGLVAIVEGMPAGLALDREALDRDMARRQLGHGRGGRMRIETDTAEIRSGVRHGRTLGSPIAILVANRDYANWEERMNPWPSRGSSPMRSICRGPVTPTWSAPRNTATRTSATSSSEPAPARPRPGSRPAASPAASSRRSG